MALGEQSPEVDIDSIAMNVQAQFAVRWQGQSDATVCIRTFRVTLPILLTRSVTLLVVLAHSE